MKKLLTIAAFALGAFTLAATTHAATFYPQEDASKLTNCDLLKSYHNNPRAVIGSYLEVNCHFGLTSNDVTLTTDSQLLASYDTGNPGEYTIEFKSQKLQKGSYSYIYQKIDGGHSPNWAAPGIASLPNMDDHAVHESKTINRDTTKTLWYYCDFGAWSGGNEKIAIYACEK